MSLSTVLDNKGEAVPIDSFPKYYNNTGPNNSVASIIATDPVSGRQWTQTYTYDSNGNVLTTSIWTTT